MGLELDDYDMRRPGAMGPFSVIYDIEEAVEQKLKSYVKQREEEAKRKEEEERLRLLEVGKKYIDKNKGYYYDEFCKYLKQDYPKLDLRRFGRLLKPTLSACTGRNELLTMTDSELSAPVETEHEQFRVRNENERVRKILNTTAYIIRSARECDDIMKYDWFGNDETDKVKARAYEVYEYYRGRVRMVPISLIPIAGGLVKHFFGKAAAALNRRFLGNAVPDIILDAGVEVAAGKTNDAINPYLADHNIVKAGVSGVDLGSYQPPTAKEPFIKQTLRDWNKSGVSGDDTACTYYYVGSTLLSTCYSRTEQERLDDYDKGADSAAFIISLFGPIPALIDGIADNKRADKVLSDFKKFYKETVGYSWEDLRDFDYKLGMWQGFFPQHLPGWLDSPLLPIFLDIYHSL